MRISDDDEAIRIVAAAIDKAAPGMSQNDLYKAARAGLVAAERTASRAPAAKIARTSPPGVKAESWVIEEHKQWAKKIAREHGCLIDWECGDLTAPQGYWFPSNTTHTIALSTIASANELAEWCKEAARCPHHASVDGCEFCESW